MSKPISDPKPPEASPAPVGSSSKPATKQDLDLWGSRILLEIKLDLHALEHQLIRLYRQADLHFDWRIEVKDKRKVNSMPLQLKITDEQKVKVTLNPVTQRGKPVKIDGKPEWSVTDGDSTLAVSEDGMSADLISADTPGLTNYMVTADADLGEGISTISDTIALTVVDPQASSLGLVAGAPEDKAAPAP